MAKKPTKKSTKESTKKPTSESTKKSDKSNAPPDRLSSDPHSPHYSEEVLNRDIGIRFKGVEKTNVSEYCVSESWVRVEVGKTKDRHGNPLTIKLTGPVEVFFKDKKK